MERFEPIKPEVFDIVRVLAKIKGLNTYGGSLVELAEELYANGARVIKFGNQDD